MIRFFRQVWQSKRI